MPTRSTAVGAAAVSGLVAVPNSKRKPGPIAPNSARRRNETSTCSVLADPLRTPTCTVRILIVHGERLAYTQEVSSAPPLSVSEARRQLAAIIDRVGVEHAPVYLARRGRRVAAVIDADDLDRILALAEDMADIRAAEEAREEMRATGEAPIPWEQVKADLGLT